MQQLADLAAALLSVVRLAVALAVAVAAGWLAKGVLCPWPDRGKIEALRREVAQLREQLPDEQETARGPRLSSMRSSYSMVPGRPARGLSRRRRAGEWTRTSRLFSSRCSRARP